MKVVFLNALQEGGASRAAQRLMKGVQDRGVDARMIVQLKSGDDPSVIGPQTKAELVMGSVRPRLEWLSVGLYSLRSGCRFSPALMPDKLPSRVAQFSPDIVHLHWVANGFMRVETLNRFDRPLVWTLHDSWAFTGGCHIPFECTRYRESCGKCPVLGSSLSLDPSRWLWRRKRRAWRGLNLAVVAPSRWLAKCAQESSLFCDARVEVVPNGLDLERYKPVDKRIARERLTLPQEKKLILFGGKNCTGDRNKGFHILAQALRELAGKGWRHTAELVVFGSPAPAQLPELGLKSHYLGWLNDEVTIALLNAAADVSVVPSIQEALSYAAVESMACGTPCVAFEQGGISDVIEHDRTGYLARPYEPDDLARGIDRVLGNDERRRSLSLQARLKVEQVFAMEKVAERYGELYREILDSAGVRNETRRRN
ncbi:MAG: glycosyltransferase family 4 protein [Nitrospirae bacterium]|nr:glycosyltransferase family 4 protein [Nitrospirota bacterium]